MPLAQRLSRDLAGLQQERLRSPIIPHLYVGLSQVGERGEGFGVLLAENLPADAQCLLIRRHGLAILAAS